MATRYLCLALILGQFSLQALAQDPSNSDELQTFRELMEDEAGDAAVSADDQDLRQLLERILILRLRKSLELSDEQLHALSRRVGTFKERLTAMKFQRGGAREQLRDCLDEGLGDEQINVRLDALLRQEKSIAELLHEMIREAAKDLTVSQTAKLYLFVGDFETFMTKLIERARYMNRRGGGSLGISDLPDSDSQEESLVRQLVQREAAGPTGRSTQDSDMVALFDGLLMAQLSQALELSPEETILLFRRVGRYKDQLHEMKWQVGGARVSLRQALDRGAPDTEIDTALKDLLLQEKAVADLVALMVTEAQKDVSLAKSARLYLFVGDFEEYVRRLLEGVGETRPASNPQ